MKKHPIYRLAKYLQNDSGRKLEVRGSQVWLNDNGVFQCVWAPGFGMDLESAIIPTHDTKEEGGYGEL